LGIQVTLENCRKFQIQRFNFLPIEADHVQAHGRWKLVKRPRQAVVVSEDAEAEICTTFKRHLYI
jgi:hypothetical protein